MLSKEQENSKTILAIFRAIEDRDAGQFRSLLQRDFEIHWPRSLPYGGTFRDHCKLFESVVIESISN